MLIGGLWVQATILDTVPNSTFGHVFNKYNCAFNTYGTCVLHACTCSKVMIFIMREGDVAITYKNNAHYS